MDPLVIALVTEILSLVPTIAQVGIAVAGLITKARAVIDASAAPDDPTWNALDAQVKAHEAAYLSAAQPGP